MSVRLSSSVFAGLRGDIKMWKLIHIANQERPMVIKKKSFSTPITTTLFSGAKKNVGNDGEGGGGGWVRPHRDSDFKWVG